MATRAPSWARRRAMPRPMRLAPPVTRMVLPVRLELVMIVDGDARAFLGETQGDAAAEGVVVAGRTRVANGGGAAPVPRRGPPRGLVCWAGEAGPGGPARTRGSAPP